jgi:spore coat polysaccharide biosynthesis protein SpsF (cytidylyltransferase family)
MGSTRLAGKALLDIEGMNAIERIVQRLRRARGIDRISVATSIEAKDDILEDLAARIGVPCHRGSETDVVGRFLGAARRFEADALLRVTGDCPLVDPALADRLIDRWRAAPDDVDLVTNIFPATWPDGIDLELFPTRVLERVAREASSEKQREWFNVYVMQRPDAFRIVNLPSERDLMHVRLTLDYPEDLELIRRIYREMHAAGTPDFGTPEILDLLARRPALARINESRVDVTVVNDIRSHAYHQLEPDEAAGDDA